MDKQTYLNRLQQLLENKDVRDSIASRFVKYMYESDSEALMEIINCAEGISIYNNYISEKECKEIIEHSINYNNTKGFAFEEDMNTILQFLQDKNKQTDCNPYFNNYALILTMHKFASDQGEVILSLVQNDHDKFILSCYDLAVAQLKDKDKIKWVRWYFNLDY